MTLIVAVDYRDCARNEIAIDASRERSDFATDGEWSLAHQDWQLDGNHRGPSRAAVFVNPMLKKYELGERILARGRLNFD